MLQWGNTSKAIQVSEKASNWPTVYSDKNKSFSAALSVPAAKPCIMLPLACSSRHRPASDGM